QKRRRPDRADKTKWRALPEPVHQVLLMRLDTVSHVNVLIVIGPVVVRNRIGDASGRDGRSEHTDLAKEQRTDEPAGSDTFNAQPAAVQPEVAPKRATGSVEHILGFGAMLVTEYSVREFLSIAGRAAIIHH